MNQEKGNVLDARNDSVIAFCISSDFSLGAGLAKEIDQNFDMRYRLFLNYDIPKGKKYNQDMIGHALRIETEDGTFYALVTKAGIRDVACYPTFTKCIADLHSQMTENGEHKLAIPKLGCGHDHMDWRLVQAIIAEEFEDSDVDVTVYTI